MKGYFRRTISSFLQECQPQTPGDVVSEGVYEHPLGQPPWAADSFLPSPQFLKRLAPLPATPQRPHTVNWSPLSPAPIQRHREARGSRAQGPGAETQRLTSVFAGYPGTGCLLKGCPLSPSSPQAVHHPGGPNVGPVPQINRTPPTQSLRGSPGGIWAFTWSLKGQGQVQQV